jgi:predicted secreted hydrolase
MVANRLNLKFLFIILFILVIGRSALAEASSNYLTVTGPCNLEFPKDHGAHPGYRTEWWYYTDNVRSQTGDLYGFQLTFFRSQISPPGADKTWPDPPSAWRRTQQIYHRWDVRAERL